MPIRKSASKSTEYTGGNSMYTAVMLNPQCNLLKEKLLFGEITNQTFVEELQDIYNGGVVFYDPRDED